MDVRTELEEILEDLECAASQMWDAEGSADSAARSVDSAVENLKSLNIGEPEGLEISDEDLKRLRSVVETLTNTTQSLGTIIREIEAG